MSDLPPPARLLRRPALLGVLVVAAAVVGIGGYVWWYGVRPEAVRGEGLRLAGAGEFDRAEPLLAGAAERNPDDLEVVEALARGYAAADDPRAEALLTRWVALAPNHPDPLRTRMAYYHKHKDPRAYPDARALADLDPADAKARRTAMNYAFSYGHFAEAEALAGELLRRLPADPHLKTILAESKRARGDLAGAAAVFDELIRENPGATGPLLARAALYEAGGEPGKAVPLLRMVFDHDPQQRRAAGYLLSVALERTGQPAEAAKVRDEVQRLQDVEVAAEAIKTQPDNFDLHVRLGERLLADGHTADGLAVLERVVARKSGYTPAHRALADYFDRVGDTARAAQHRPLAGP